MHLTIYKLLKNVTSSKGVPGGKMLDWQVLNAHWNPFIVDPSIQIPTRIPETLIPEFTRTPEKRPTTELFIY